MAAYGIPDNPALVTTSRLRAWWLHSIWGYRVLDIRRKPTTGWFGRLAYNETIRMLPGKRDTIQ
ncbi:MAG: hypothetical protein HYV27_08380 [Candidatus Hydrogenedentes bacterium]|nr:hypothetical protein [Candidatus Hydrogenedentota bacterium]